MTKSDRITPRRPNEGITVAQTAVSYGFTELLRSLDACIAAERPLQRGVADIFAANFDTALTEAEQARDALLASATAVIEVPEDLPTDRVLRFLDQAGIVKREARNNPKKAEPGQKAQERVAAQKKAEEDAAAKKAADEAAAAEAANAPATEETSEEAAS